MITRRLRCQPRGTDDRRNEGLKDAELHALFDRLFAHGFARAHVLAEIAPEGWGQSLQLACFHPSLEQRYEKTVQLHRNIEALRNTRPCPDSDVQETTAAPLSRRWRMRARSINRRRSGRRRKSPTWSACVIAAGGRVADMGSSRGAGPFLDERLTRGQDGWQQGDYRRFCLGTFWIPTCGSQAGFRDDLPPTSIVGADCVYLLSPALYLTELVRSDSDAEQAGTYSVSKSAAAALNAQKRRAEMARLRAEIYQMNARARE